MLERELVEVGYAYRPHGIKGGLVLQLHNIQKSVLNSQIELYLFPSDGRSNLQAHGQKFILKKITFGHKVIGYLEGIEHIDDLLKILPCTIKIKRNLFSECEEDEFYCADLVGLKVFEFESGKELGTVEKTYSNGVQEVICIKTTKDKKIELPFVNNFFPKVDLDEKVIYIRLPQYI